MRGVVAMALVGMVAAMPASAHVGYDGGGSGSLNILEQVRVERLAKLTKIRRLALQQRAADGGTLSPESTARLQREIDLVETSYNQQMRKYDPFGVNADGSPVNR